MCSVYRHYVDVYEILVAATEFVASTGSQYTFDTSGSEQR